MEGGNPVSPSVLEAGDDGTNEATLGNKSESTSYVSCYVKVRMELTWTPSGLIAMKLQFTSQLNCRLHMLPELSLKSKSGDGARGGGQVSTYVCSFDMLASEDGSTESSKGWVLAVRTGGGGS